MPNDLVEVCRAVGKDRASIGSAILVAEDVAVLHLAGRDTEPALPLQVLVPIAAGGDRDEHNAAVRTGQRLQVVPVPRIACR